MSGMKIMILLLIIGFIVPTLWNSVPIIKDSVHAALDPTLEVLLVWNVQIGFILSVGILTFITTLIYKYATDQKTLKEIKEEQKLLQAEMKKYKDHPEKLLEFQKKSIELTIKLMPMVLRPAVFTIIPFILLFRWFGDFFASNPVKIFGFMHWILGYIIISLIFSPIFRKMLKVS